jgi:hypothetical protein
VIPFHGTIFSSLRIEDQIVSGPVAHCDLSEIAGGFATSGCPSGAAGDACVEVMAIARLLEVA